MPLTHWIQANKLLVCLLVITQLPGTEKTELERGLWSSHLAESPATLRKCCPPPRVLPPHSAPHLKALVMHSSSPATSRVIQFPQQQDRVKFHLHLGVGVQHGFKRLPASVMLWPFTTLLSSGPYNKQQEVDDVSPTFEWWQRTERIRRCIAHSG